MRIKNSDSMAPGYGTLFRWVIRSVLWCGMLTVVSCSSDKTSCDCDSTDSAAVCTDADSDTDGDSDSDTDGDNDADSDGDSESDTDGESDSNTGMPEDSDSDSASEADPNDTDGIAGAPFLFSPRLDGFSVSVVMDKGDPRQLVLQVREEMDTEWSAPLSPDLVGGITETADAAHWDVRGLNASTLYRYRLMRVADSEDDTDSLTSDSGATVPVETDSDSASDTEPNTVSDSATETSDTNGNDTYSETETASDAEGTDTNDIEKSVHLFEDTVVTSPNKGESFSVALLTDTHIGADLSYTNQGYPDVLETIGSQISILQPDFMINLGDMLDFHQFGFNDPPPNGAVTRSAYMNYRKLLGPAPGHVPHFPVIGNWEGENGNFTDMEIEWSREARRLYMPGPGPDTYPEGGSEEGDYYAFTWGDALFLVLNVQTYTPTAHLLSSGGEGTADDWTLGQAQMEWLENTLKNATSTWRFICIHHTVGGQAGTVADSNYGRGGGQAAYVGEQARVHQLMMDYGVQIFFYGHDHVFTDMVVDNIHYTLPGNAGARWMFYAGETGYEQYWPEWGWTRMDVSPNNVRVQFIQLDGRVLHEYSLQK
ncbi:MAG: metallophosphoesterase [Deltaproteobacteria bacterium]|nr:metallophosphoesterase [Deltaproteobacteria bacterium]